MRLLVGGLLLAGVATPGLAADLDASWLRGSSSFAADPPRYQRWSGLYGGGQIGEDFRGVDFRSSAGAALGSIMAQDSALSSLPVSQMPVLPALAKTSPIFGGFLGYNYQIDDVVLGYEANFNWANMSASAASQQSRSYTETLNAHTYAPVAITVTNSAKITLNDYGSFRVRGGWAYGSFLPYMFAGVSVAQVDTARAVNVFYTATDVTPQTAGVPALVNLGGNYTQGDQSRGKYVFGFSGGAGIDYALTRNVFLRGEVEYLQLSSSNDIKLNTTSVRAGAGLKF